MRLAAYGFLFAGLVALSLFVNPVAADHDDGAAWSWHVLSAGADESRVAIYRQRDLLGIFNFSCDLTAEDEPGEEPAANLELVQPESHPDGLLVIRCNVGAHSQYLALVDPAQRTVRPAFEVTGSYHAGWEIQDGELWIGYDRPCAEGISVECPDGFETVFVRYPGP